VALLGLVWMIALRAHSSNPSEPAPSSSSAPTAATSPVAQSKAATPTHVYHGAAPGVEGLTRAVAKAHGAVAASEQSANQLKRQSAEASGETHTPASAPAKTAASKGTSSTTAKQQSVLAASHTRNAVRHRSTPTSKSHPGRSAAQVTVEGELAHGKTVMLVFWNPKSTVDREVEQQAGALAGHSKGTVRVHAALPSKVGTFGKITEVAYVYQTPTILIVNKRGVVSTLTGLTDVFALQQAVKEARTATR
jgi:hypothetical protein